jgi:hypothetical protein
MTLMRAVFTAAVVMLSAAGAFAADCTSLLKAVSQPGSFPNRAAGPVAWTGTDFGIAKVEGTQQRPVFFSFLDSELNPASADIQIASSSRDGATALLWTGTEFGLFYEMLQRISAAGAPIGSAVQIAATYGAWLEREIDLMWDTTLNAYVLVYTVPQGANRGLWLAIIEPNGVTRTETLVNSFTTYPVGPQVARTSAGLVVVYHSSFTGQMNSTLYRADGTFSQAFAFAAPGSNGQLAWNGSVLAYVASVPVTGGSEIHWTRLDASGNLVSREARWFAARGVDAAPVHLLWNAEDKEWVLGFRDSILGFNQSRGDYRLSRFTASGSLLSETFFSPEQPFQVFDSKYPFVWTGTSYVGTASRIVSSVSGSQSFVVRHCPIRATAQAARRFVNVNEEVQFSASVSGGAAPFTYEWDLGDINLGTVYGPTPKHRYRNTGTYVVTLTVIDSVGARSVTTTTIDVVVPKRRAVRK